MSAEVKTSAGVAKQVEAVVACHLSIGRANIVTFVDELLLLIADFGDLECALSNDQKFCFKTQGNVLCEIEHARARTMLRAACARLSVVAAEKAGCSFSPYGDKAEFVWEILPQRKVSFSLVFTNTTDKQEFAIRVRHLTTVAEPNLELTSAQ